MEKQNEFEISFYITRNDPLNNKISKGIELFNFNYFRNIDDSNVAQRKFPKSPRIKIVRLESSYTFKKGVPIIQDFGDLVFR